MSASPVNSEGKTKESEKAKDGGSGIYGTTKAHADQMIERSLKHSALVKFLIGAMEKAGCPVGDNFFRSEECDMQVSGGFMPEEGVVVCSNRVLYEEEVDAVLAHELVHAYDHCRAASLHWANCRHHACSEIRAANLSTACYMHKEFLTRGSQFRLRAGHQACVRRKALLSVAMNPNCSQREAREAVDAVWEKCYKDTAPFERIP